MRPWLLRGGVLAVVFAAVETVLDYVQINHPTIGTVLDPILLALLVGVSGAWGGVDGWLRRPHRGMHWFYAGLIGGVLAGVLSVIGRAAFVDQTGAWALGSALTGDAAFVALLIMLPAGLGVFVGGRLQPPPGVSDGDEPVRFQGRLEQGRLQGRRSLRSAPRA